LRKISTRRFWSGPEFSVGFYRRRPNSKLAECVPLFDRRTADKEISIVGVICSSVPCVDQGAGGVSQWPRYAEGEPISLHNFFECWENSAAVFPTLITACGSQYSTFSGRFHHAVVARARSAPGTADSTPGDRPGAKIRVSSGGRTHGNSFSTTAAPLVLANNITAGGLHRKSRDSMAALGSDLSCTVCGASWSSSSALVPNASNETPLAFGSWVLGSQRAQPKHISRSSRRRVCWISRPGNPLWPSAG